MKNTSHTAIKELTDKYSDVKSAAPLAGTQPSDDLWAEIQRLSEEREARKSQVQSRPGHSKR